MTVSEVKGALGEWGFRLRDTTPKQIIDMLDANRFGHIAILPGRVPVEALGDAMLTQARYVGVYHQLFKQKTEYELHGESLNYWAGDSDGRGDVFTTAKTFSASTFSQVVTALMPQSGALALGTVYSISASGTYTATIQWDTPRRAWDRVCTYFSASASNPVEWRVNGDGTVDFGEIDDLYPSTLNPRAILVRKLESGRDLQRVAIQSEMSLDTDVEDYVTQMFVLGEGSGSATPVGSASATVVPYAHLRGGNVRIVEVFNEPDATAAEVNAIAAIALSENETLRRAAQISTDEFDVKGTFGPGDTVYVYDPRAGFVNTNNEINWQGEPINPIALRVEEVSWPIPAEWTVAFRANDGTWFDLSNWYAPESGATRIQVGGFAKRLYGGLGPDLNGRATPDSSIPGVPAFGTFYSGTYESVTDNATRAQVQVSWSRPNNTDGSTITDLSHYEIRFRPNVQMRYPATHAEMQTRLYNQLLLHGQPIVPPLSPLWQTIIVGPDSTDFMIQELVPGVAYDFQIRAVDIASPPNLGAWSNTTTYTAARDQTAPNQPAAPAVAGSRVSIQVTSNLGSSTGGTFNLAADLDHLEVHVGGGPDFECNEGSLVGKLTANIGMMRAQIPAVGTFPIESVTGVFVRLVAVDRTGNKSSPSDAGTATALLIDSAHISDLTVSKVTAGTITATWLMAGEIKTAETGARARMSLAGFETFNALGSRTFFADATTGNVEISGVFKTGTAGQRIEIRDEEPFSTIRFYGSRSTSQFAYIAGVDMQISGVEYLGIAMNTGNFRDSTGAEVYNRVYLSSDILIERTTAIGQALAGGRLFMTVNATTLEHLTGQVMITAGTDMFITGTSDVVIAATAGDVFITGALDAVITATAGNAFITATAGSAFISAADSITIQNSGGNIFMRSRTSGSARRGLMELTQADTYVGFDGTTATGELNYWRFNQTRTIHIGKWGDFVDDGATAGTWFADFVTAANVTSVAIGFGVARSTTMIPVYAVRDTNTTIRSTQINAQSTSSFTIELDGATAGAAGINVQAFRIA